MKNSIKKSFTLMELLVVVAIIGVLVAITIPAINVARAKARDAKRTEDLRNFSFALEQYYENHQQYPVWAAGGGFQDGGGNNPLKVLVDEKIISSLPQDPLISKYVYYYITTDNGQTYKTVAYMEQDKQKAEKDGGTASTYYEAFAYPPEKQQAQLTDATLDEKIENWENYGTTSCHSLSEWERRTDWDLSDNYNGFGSTLADLDNDGDFDLMVGSYDGISYAYENTGTSFSPVWTRKSAWDATFDVGERSTPEFGNLDGDDDYDLMIGSSNGYNYGLENTGTSSSPVWTRKSAWDLYIGDNVFTLNALIDIDNDGDLDLFGNFNYASCRGYENTGTSSSPVWTRKSAWDAPSIGQEGKYDFADLDCDGDFDLLRGNTSGTIVGYENTGTSSSPVWTRKSAWDISGVSETWAAVSLSDLNKDLSPDLLTGGCPGYGQCWPARGYKNK